MKVVALAVSCELDMIRKKVVPWYNRAQHPGDDYLDNYLNALLSGHITVTPINIGI